MKKQYKIKRYRRGHSGAGRILKWLGTILGLAVLVFVGISIYNPVYNFIMGNYEPRQRPEQSAQEPQSVQAGQGEDTEDAQAQQPVAQPEPQPQGTAPKAVYLPLAVAGDETQLAAFISSLEGSGVDSVMVDIKDRNGNVLFRTANADALAWGAATEGAGLDLKALSGTLAQNGLSLTVRMSAFADPIGARGNDGANGIRYQGGDWMWLDAAADAGGKPWINPYSPTGKQYLADLAVEAVEAGATLVILEHVQFPDGSMNGNATFGAEAQGVDRQQALAAFVSEMTGAVEGAGGQLGVYVTAVSVTQDDYNQVRYGGSPLEIVDNTIVLGLLPYQFYTGFSSGGLELETPFESASATVSVALQYVQGKLGGRDVRIIPLLQGGYETTANAVQIDTNEVTAQVETAWARGAEGYVLYQTAGAYSLS